MASELAVKSNTRMGNPFEEPGKAPKNAAIKAVDAKAAAPTKPAKNSLEKLARKSETYLAIGLIFFFAALFITGRQLWDERYYIPEEGLGYYLGLVGGVMMLFALAYSLFKYVGALRRITKMKTWLTIHIAMGIIGPILILVHSTFHIGSLNGGIALVSMMLVLLSGIAGRYLYSKVHYGLGGHKAQMGDLLNALKQGHDKLHSEQLDQFTAKVMKRSKSMITAFWELCTYNIRGHFLYKKLCRNVDRKLLEMAQAQNWDQAFLQKNSKRIKRQIRSYLLLLQKVALFKLYERFFAFWRYAHVPLLYLLFFSGIAHVIAVHMY